MMETMTSYRNRETIQPTGTLSFGYPDDASIFAPNCWQSLFSIEATAIAMPSSTETIPRLHTILAVNSLLLCPAGFFSQNTLQPS
jgi:hypothetical protein